jgi:hypothetical protein
MRIYLSTLALVAVFLTAGAAATTSSANATDDLAEAKALSQTLAAKSTARLEHYRYLFALRERLDLNLAAQDAAVKAIRPTKANVAAYTALKTVLPSPYPLEREMRRSDRFVDLQGELFPRLANTLSKISSADALTKSQQATLATTLRVLRSYNTPFTAVTYAARQNTPETLAELNAAYADFKSGVAPWGGIDQQDQNRTRLLS